MLLAPSPRLPFPSPDPGSSEQTAREGKAAAAEFLIDLKCRSRQNLILLL